MMFLRKYLLIICFLFPVAANAGQEAKKWQLNTDKSAIKFSVAIEGSPVGGEFTNFTAAIAFDPKKMAQSKVSMTIDLNYIEAAYSDVAENLKKKDWFDIENFPLAHFVSRSFKHLGGRAYQVTGEFSLRGITRPEVLYFTLEEYDEHQAVIKGKMEIYRLNYGVGQGGWSNVTIVSGQVFLDVLITAISE
ncbi:MAG: YceI family protein [Emcibacter sp.]|nr:YceI family protein [Emcibacter sp.]